MKLVIENYPEGKEELCAVPNHPQKPDWGKREVPFSRELWIEREDFMETPPKGYFRLFPGNKVRLRYGFVVECTGYDRRDRTRCAAHYDPDTKSGTPGAEKVKVKGNIHWVSAKHATRRGGAALRPPLQSAASRPFVPSPSGEGQGGGGADERDCLADLNPDSRKISHRPARTGAQRREARGALPVRAARLFRRRWRGLEVRRAGIQSGSHLARFLG